MTYRGRVWVVAEGVVAPPWFWAGDHRHFSGPKPVHLASTTWALEVRLYR